MDPSKEPGACLECFVWDGFGAGLAYPKGLTPLFVGDFDESSPQLRCAGPAAFQRKAGLDATKRPVIIDKRFWDQKGHQKRV
jgi:hypothetical protein